MTKALKQNLLTVLGDVLPDFGHGVADVGVGVEDVMVLLGVPVGESGELLGDRLEEANNDTHWSALHVMAELLNSSSILKLMSVGPRSNVRYI